MALNSSFNVLRCAWGGTRHVWTYTFCQDKSKTTTTTTTTRLFIPWLPFLWRLVGRPLAGVPMMEDGAAKRRRLRRLRSWWRHEQQAVAAVLATIQHHSDPRGQKAARTGGEGARDELHGQAPDEAPPPSPRRLVRSTSAWTTRRLRQPPCGLHWWRRCSRQSGTGGTAGSAPNWSSIPQCRSWGERLSRHHSACCGRSSCWSRRPSRKFVLFVIRIQEEGGEYGSAPSNILRTPSQTAHRIHQPLGSLADLHYWTVLHTALEVLQSLGSKADLRIVWLRNRYSNAPPNKLWTVLVLEFQSELWSRPSMFLDRLEEALLALQLPRQQLRSRQITGFFSNFSQQKKSARSGRQSNMQSHCQPSTGVACEAEYVEHDGLWYGRQWDPVRQRYCWWLLEDDRSRLGPIVWRPPWEIDLGLGGGGG